MMRLGTVFLTATMTVLLLWLLVGCTGGDGRSDQRQSARQEERTVSVVPRQPTVSVEAEDNRNSKLVFQSGSGEIWAMNALGSEPVRLTEKGKQYPNTSLSPDGKKIAYAVYKRPFTGIYKINVGGGGKVRVTPRLEFAESPSWGSRP
jgi:hypothetical protein